MAMEEETQTNHAFTVPENLAHQFSRQAEEAEEAEAEEAGVVFLLVIGIIVKSEIGQVFLITEVGLGVVL
jgi:hypothetical protein